MPTIVSANANKLCSAAGLAEILGVTDRRVRQLVRDGILKSAQSRLNGMHFRLAESVQRFAKYKCDLVSEKLEASNGEYDRARAKRMAAMAAMAELELKAKQGFYFRRDDIDFHLTHMITACKQRLLAIPSRVMHRLLGLTNAREANQIVDDEIRLALTEVSEAKWKNTVEFLQAQAAYLREQGLQDDEIEKMRDERERRRNGEKPAGDN